MDEVNGTLMGRHGYCTQELVNLLLTGEAVSNVFNDVKELDSGTGDVMLLRGISARSDIGLLSLFEHYRSCEVSFHFGIHTFTGKGLIVRFAWYYLFSFWIRIHCKYI
jgi:hypothetical protein